MGRRPQFDGMRFAALLIAAILAVFALDLAIPLLAVTVLYIPLIILAA
jgi:hypothetical protein